MGFLGLLGCEYRELDASGSGSAKGLGVPCEPHVLADCEEGLACEPMLEPMGEYGCWAPFELRGRVIDALDERSIEGARVTAADERGAPVTAVVETDAEGRYVLPVSVARDAAGAPARTPVWTLLVSARDYLAFPGPLRPALPIDAGTATSTAEGSAAPEPWAIDDASTMVALIPLGSDRPRGVTINGRVEGQAASGTLVVAEGLDPASMAVADADGEFTLFNVPPGTANVRGYRRGVELEPAVLSVGSEDIDDVRLAVRTQELSAMAVVEGSVNLVDAGGGGMTSVVLVPSSVYADVFEHGPVPLGLRAPAPPEAPSITSKFSIDGVPAGVYRVVAAFENDQLVRDPDASISGTQVLEIDVAAGESVVLDSSVKVTAALELLGPGADGTEEVAGAPVFGWTDDASEDRYELVVYDARGTEVWRDEEIPRVTGGGRVELPYGGPPLVSGMFHQFRVTSWSDGPQGSIALSRTEDLRGVFVVR